MERVLRLILKSAATELPVLILGETGVGKELVARRIHESGRRADRPLMAINCAALTETLLESELFGHVKGAFTGANRARKGRLEEADGGTVFLDEVGDMSAACQAKLLRVLDHGEVSAVGSNEVRKIDIRVIAATNRRIDRADERKSFRADLYYRLCGFQIDVPPLRDRREDIPILTRYFLEQLAAESKGGGALITPPAMTALTAYGWPGNVRELQHAAKTAAALAEGRPIDLEHLPWAITESEGGGNARMVQTPPEDAGAISVGDSAAREKPRILEALQRTAYAGSGRWNIAKAARELGMNRKTLEYKIHEVYRLKA
jgi:transcriptional regulator with GAF, ATPase, and Fis domain